MEKLAETEYEIHHLMRRRWSPRAFADRAVGEQELRSLLEAARWAASCFNDQPWRFLVTRRGEEAFDRLLSCLTEKNQQWAGRAPVLMLSVARMVFAKNGKPNRHAMHDVGQAAAQLALQATELGLCVHQMAGYSPEAAREAFGIPEAFEPAAAIAIGYLGRASDLPDPFRAMELGERSRLPVSEMAFAGRWGEPL